MPRRCRKYLTGVLPIIIMCTVSIAEAASTSCTEDGLLSLLQQKIASGQGEHLEKKLWWKRCAVSVRQRVWKRFSLKGTESKGAPWQQATTSPLPYLGTAQELVGTGNWFNSEPFTLLSKRKNVVLVNFWTHGCINCIHTLPHMKKLWNTYRDTKKFVLLGVHTPEFAYEKRIQNVQEAPTRYGITHPVVQDNDFGTWNAFSNQYWPAFYLIDPEGNIRYTHFGEGSDDEMDKAIASLMEEAR